VMVPTTTAVLLARWSPFILRTRRAKDIGGRLMRDMNRRLRMTLLKLDPVRGQEAVRLDQEAEVDILGDWRITVWALLVVTLVVTDIDTHGQERLLRSLRV